MSSRLYQIVLEARKNSKAPKKDDNEEMETDEEVNDNPDGDNESDSYDYTEEVEEISEDDEVDEPDTTEGDEPPQDEDSEQEPGSSEEDQGTDYSDENNTEDSNDNEEPSQDDDDAEPSEEEENIEENPEDHKQRIILIKDYMNLYEFINDTIEKLNSNTNINLIIQQVINRVNENLRQLREQLYDYIICDFKKDSYINSLTIYNYFIEAVKVNSQMIVKISEYSSKKEQKSNSRTNKKVSTKNKK